jgi:hypothetical protein
MKGLTAARIGAVAFLLWGLVHVAGGAMLLMARTEDGPAAALRLMSSGVSPSLLPGQLDLVTGAALTFHFWNLAWIGGLVAAVAVTLNWRNRLAGFWINLVVVAAADAGMVATLLAPGVISPAEGSVGLILAAVGAIFGALGLAQVRTERGLAAA